MNKEAQEAIDYIFLQALEVLNNGEDRDSAIKKIHAKFKTNENSCGMYFRIIGHMIQGERYMRGMSASATDYLLKNFYTYENGKYFNKSISALEQFIKHNEKTNGITMHKLNNILKKWTTK